MPNTQVSLAAYRNGKRVLPAVCLLLPLLSAVADAADAADKQPRQAAKSGDAPREGRFFLYVSVSGESRIARFAINAQTGALTAKESVPASGSPGCLAVGPGARFLYAAIRSKGRVETFRIDPTTGNLKSEATAEAVDNPVYLSVDKTGTRLLTAYYGAGKAAVYAIDRSGHAGGEALQVVTTQKNPHSILADRSNRYVFVPNTGSDLILQFRFNAETGGLTPSAEPQVATAAGAGPRHIWFHPSLDTVYVVNEKNSTVAAYRLNTNTGGLTAFQTLSTLPEDFSGGNTCADIELTPSGRYLYASNRGHDSIAAYAVHEKTGELKRIGVFPTEATPRSFNIDPSGRFLYAAGQGSGKLASYRINQETGALQPLAVYKIGKSPAWVQTLRVAE